MQNIIRIIYAAVFGVIGMLISPALFAQFVYQSPVDGSAYQKTQSSIILKAESVLNPSSVEADGWISIKGSRSGLHSYTARLARDGRTIMVRPDQPFDYDETVSVSVGDQLQLTSGARLAAAAFSFTTEKRATPQEMQQRLIARRHYDSDVMPATGLKQEVETDSMPTFKITINNNASKGSFFWNNQSDFHPEWTNCYNVIMSNSGKFSYARDMGLNGHDFKINYNGYLTYFDYDHYQWIMADSNFNKIDSFKCSNGYESATNAHDFIIYPDGEYYMIAYDDQTVDMTPYGGLPNATVTGLILQKFDADKNMVFQWRSWDHLNITDANNNVSLVGGLVDYVHGNSVEKDTDGNLFYSSRSMCDVVKINAETGEIMWRLGGENNQFTFINDPIAVGFQFQHDARRLPNGNILLFNNGNYLPVQESSAKEYEIDEVNMTATLVWSYTHPWVNNGATPVFGRASGSAQRLNNGNTLIGWGTVLQNPTMPNVTEVDQAGNIVWEMAFDSAGWKSYRFKKYEWNPCSRPTGYTMQSVVKPGKVTLTWEAATGAKSYIIRYKPEGNGPWTQVSSQKSKFILLDYQTSTDYVWKVKTVCGNGNSSNYSEEQSFTTAAQRLLHDEKGQTEIRLYPNPAGNDLQVYLSNGSKAGGKLAVFNLNGVEVLSQPAETGTEDYRFDLSELPAGIYCLQWQNGEEQVITRFVKE
jgi:hypothetical protein